MSRFTLVVLALLVCNVVLQSCSQLLTFRAAYDAPAEYGIMIDAGSTGSRLHIFTWPQRKAGTIPGVHIVQHLNETWTDEVSPGISSYASKPSQVSQSLRPLIDWAINKLSNITQQNRTPLYLKATAGMRILPTAQQKQVMRYVREYLASTPFLFKSAEIIPGYEEGIFGWVTVNFLLGNFLSGNPSAQTWGAMDMGGASTQMTFEPSIGGRPREDCIAVTLGNEVTYYAYAHSYNGFGLNEAQSRLNVLLAGDAPNATTVFNPCLPDGYSDWCSVDDNVYNMSGTGKKLYCTLVLQQLFPTADCPNKPCTFNGTYQPIVGGHFMAFSAFQYSVDFFGLSVNATAADFSSAATSFLDLSWEDLIKKYGNVKFLQVYGFQALYVYQLLEVYGFVNNGNAFITYLSTMKNSWGVEVTVDWSLGAMIYEAGQLSGF